MSEIITVGLDLAKNVFQVHGADGAGRTVLRKKLRRAQVLEFFSVIALCTVAMAACGGSHFWGREIAWLGLVPRQHSTGGKQRLGATTRMGERSLRRLLIIGANRVIIKRHVHASARPRTWLGGMLSCKPPMLVRVALANKMARIVWALMVKGGEYRAPAASA
ncbi:transposase [Paracoccus sp. (in: a-proteobacteria)]|uniref:transposase n=1 Tax=Paracoccus sp. TaxID=267 RepID=UPI002AFE317B|nr:transposase [Paracoccus sp. (in: a-proteobacteria)]